MRRAYAPPPTRLSPNRLSKPLPLDDSHNITNTPFRNNRQISFPSATPPPPPSSSPMPSFISRYTSHSHSPSAPPLPNPQPPSSYQSQPQLFPPHPGVGSSYGYYSFPPGTHPEIIRSFQMVDRDMSGYIDEIELQQALSSGYQRFNLRTIRLLMFLFKNPTSPAGVGKILLRSPFFRCGHLFLFLDNQTWWLQFFSFN